MRSLSSCLEATRMWRRTERASLEKKPSIRLSREPWVGVKVNSKRCAAGHNDECVAPGTMCCPRRSGAKHLAGRLSHFEQNDP